VAGLLHPAREPANNHRAAFAEYAHSASWTAVHLGQFAGMAVIITGLLLFYVALLAWTYSQPLRRTRSWILSGD
jgi:hypothetical protein